MVVKKIFEKKRTAGMKSENCLQVRRTFYAGFV